MLGSTIRCAVVAAAILFVSGCATQAPTPKLAAAPVEPPPPTTSFTVTPDQHEIGTTATYVTQQGDTLLDVARHYDLGYTQLMTANPGLDPWSPGVGRKVTLPATYILPAVPRRGIVVNLVQQRLYYFHPDGKTVETFPIGTGVQGRATPLGVTTIVHKEVHPVWHVPASIRAEDPDLPSSVPPGPDNPLGDYAMMLGWGSYLIHGTNKPDGVGRNVSHGCMHLYPEDIAHLFDEVPMGTPVRIVDQEVQTAWLDDGLYIAVFPNKDQAEAIDEGQKVDPAPPAHLHALVRRSASGHAVEIDWDAVDTAGRERTGIPVRVSLPEVAAANTGS